MKRLFKILGIVLCCCVLHAVLLRTKNRSNIAGLITAMKIAEMKYRPNLTIQALI